MRGKNVFQFFLLAPSTMFPICLGCIGTGLLWRLAADALGAPAAIGEAWSLMSVGLFLISAVSYARKLALRPRAILLDLGPLPARAAISAASMCTMLAAAVIEPYSPRIAALVLFVGVAHHFIHACLVLWVLFRSAPGAWTINPTLYPPFVGQIVAPIAGVPLGYWSASALIYLSAVLAWAVITLISLRQIFTAPIPKSMRQCMVIFLAPAGAGVISADVLNAGFSLAMIALFGVAMIGFALWLAMRLDWLVEGGWSPAWGSFTFPTAALAGGAITIADRVGGGALSILSWPFVLGCTLTILIVLKGAVSSIAKGRLDRWAQAETTS